MAKNIVVFSDGTGQEGGEGYNTNVYKMFNMIEDRTPRQVGYYDAGLGTGMKKITGNIGGMGISRNIQQCYRFIFDHYEAGDSIYLFGFSRGAATIRSLSSFIHYFGILPKGRPELIPKAYGIYRTSNPDLRKSRADEFVRKNRTMWTRIRFIGCYDTVAALGLPIRWLSDLIDGLPMFRHNFHNFTLSESVENAYHALAIDDERKYFHPVLWNTDLKPYQSLSQVWFTGMHTDVGGGYPEQELSDIPLLWLTQKACDLGLRLYLKHKVPVTINPYGVMHDSRGSFLAKLYPRAVRTWDAKRTDRIRIHQSVIDRMTDDPNRPEHLRYTPWIAGLDHDIEPWSFDLKTMIARQQRMDVIRG